MAPLKRSHGTLPGRGRGLARMAGRAASGLVVVVALVGIPGAAAAADPVTFGDPTASSTFGQFIEFRQPVTLSATPKRVELLLATPGAIGPEIVAIPAATSSGSSVLDYRLDLTTGNIVPNTTFTARWRVIDGSDVAWLGPPLRRTYADDRFTWKTLDGNVVRVHWVDGDQAFGRRALKIGDDAVAATARLLGVTETSPIDFFIYPDQASFYAALGPATRENVGGQAHPDIRTLFALITPSDINASWVESVVPHELTHVVFATAVDNPYHDPPHWLNEGLAVYLSDGFAASDRLQIRQAAAAGSIIPLGGLAGAFPTTRERFFLAYAESVSAVDRIVRVNGRDALVKLIRSYRDGVSDDEAFQAALGRTVAGFETDWLGEIGATAPARRGPQPAPAGPLPTGWSGPQSNPSFDIVGSPPAAANGPLPRGSGPEDPLAGLLIPSSGVLGVVLVAVLVALGYRRLRRRAAAVSWSPSGHDQPPGSASSDREEPWPGRPSLLWPTSISARDDEPETGRATDVGRPAAPSSRAVDPRPRADPLIDPPSSMPSSDDR